MRTLQDIITRRIKRVKEHLSTYDLKKPHKIYNYHGGWAIGYLQGKLTTLEDIQDDMPELDSSIISEDFIKELLIETFRTSANVNNPDTGCRITHKPTGIIVTVPTRGILANNKRKAIKALHYLVENNQ